MKITLLQRIARLQLRADTLPYRGKFRFTHKGTMTLKGMSLDKPGPLRKELEKIIQSVKPKVTLGDPKVAHFKMYGRTIASYAFPITPADSLLHSGGAEDPTTIAFHKICDALEVVGFKRGKSKKKKKKSTKNFSKS